MEKDLLKLYADETKQLLWRKSGMDTIRNIALLVVLGMILASFGFGEAPGHRVPYFESLVVFALVLIETRLFRFYAINVQRVQLLEQNLLSSVSAVQQAQGQAWEQELAESYATPSAPPFFEALAYRIYRNYFLIFLAVDSSWLANVYLSPQPAVSFSEFVHRLDLGFFSGWATLGFMIVFWALFIAAIVRIRAKKKQKNYLRG